MTTVENISTDKNDVEYAAPYTECNAGTPPRLCNNCRRTADLPALPEMSNEEYALLMQEPEPPEVTVESVEDKINRLTDIIDERDAEIARDQARINDLIVQRDNRVQSYVVDDRIAEAQTELRQWFYNQIWEYGRGCNEGKTDFTRYCNLEEFLPRQTLSFVVDVEVPESADSYNIRTALHEWIVENSVDADCNDYDITELSIRNY